MGTQAVISILDPHNVMLLKVVAGGGGGAAKKFADILAVTGELDPQKICEEAVRTGMRDVMVMSRDEHYHEFEEYTQHLLVRGVATFHDPEFNPREMDGRCISVWKVLHKSEGENVVVEGFSGPKHKALWHPLDPDDMARAIKEYREGNVIAVETGGTTYYTLLGRLCDHRIKLQQGLIDNPGGKTVQQIAEGKL